MSEDMFRDRIVRPLFLRMGFGDARETHGPLEAGKDLVITEVDRFGHLRLIAVQTKRGKLTMAREPKHNVDVAITQLRTATKDPVPLAGGKLKAYPAEVVLCASGEINKSARDHILEELNRNPTIRFLDAEDLISLIDQHIPELWLDVDPDVTAYLQALRGILLADGAPAVEPNNGALALLDAASDARYVNLTIFKVGIERYRERKTVKSRPKVIKLPATSVIDKNEPLILLLGEPGSGKSTCIKRIALTLIDRHREKPEKALLPVYARAMDLDLASGKSLVDLALSQIYNRLGRLTKPPFTHEDLAAGRLRLLIDGLDEIPSTSDQQTLLRLISDFHVHYPNCQVILASRDYATIRELDLIHNYSDYRLEPLSLNQAIEMVTRLNCAKTITRQVLQRLHQVYKLQLSPLLVIIFALTSDDAREDVPASITEIFKQFTELMLGRWDKAKGIDGHLDAQMKDFVLRRLALSMHQRKIRILPVPEAYRIAKNDLERVGYRQDARALLDDILGRSGLLAAKNDQIEFRHHILQEFFAGRGISDQSFIESTIGDPWWRTSIVFWYGEHPEEGARLKSVLEAASIKQNTEKFEGAVSCGLALQACYLTDVDSKRDVYWQVLSMLAVTQDAVSAALPELDGYQLLGFLGMYFMARYSAGITALPQLLAATGAQPPDGQEVDKGTLDRIRFWTITGLIETGNYSLAGDAVRGFNPDDGVLILALRMELILSRELRNLSPAESKMVNDLAERLGPRANAYREQLVKELEGILSAAKQSQPRLGRPTTNNEFTPS